MLSARVMNLDQQSFIKMETLRGHMPIKIYGLLREICGANVLNRFTIFRWSAKFKGVLESVDDPHLG